MGRLGAIKIPQPLILADAGDEIVLDSIRNTAREPADLPDDGGHAGGRGRRRERNAPAGEIAIERNEPIEIGLIGGDIHRDGAPRLNLVVDVDVLCTDRDLARGDAYLAGVLDRPGLRNRLCAGTEIRHGINGDITEILGIGERKRLDARDRIWIAAENDDGVLVVVLGVVPRITATKI